MYKILSVFFKKNEKTFFNFCKYKMLYITFYFKNVINNTTINKLYKIVFKTKQRNYKFFR